MQISRYNAIDLSVRVLVVPFAGFPITLIYIQEDVQEDWGWKLVHGEVFRTPRFPMVLAIVVGNGAQLCVMVGVTLGIHAPSFPTYIVNFVSLVFALLGFLSPSNRGSLATVMMVCWSFFGG